ncbi:5'-methylthioadenosine/adenosylhomocysteine nucleosidase [Cellulophaga baltica]|uniref:5'-methylthioadenosine/adenosylhomocysteine nucleosidase n=1 Tax=Cellulophaga TaxID=104264 RepID=UPI001C074DE8|nr:MULTISPECIES: 5'-methylthioadenosine/adenosylhomocysteine nucleosidase [Cellulophaga]MBU2996310.1 5'-methylthioadenosine/adenosylhomocysteine nucleosidase [Cellulophaga baltica]MDO6767705.1 5'-methylthioadenosine/adenosylhomocysteine nucleosidase [Cellulophaga sp. 1_MG-2023]
MKKSLFLIVFFIVCSLQAQRIAIMGAMDEEIELLKEALKNKKEVNKNGVTFYIGKLKKKKVVLLKSGIGKVNAAYSTAILMANFKIEALVFTGVAGGLHPDILPGDIVIADKMVQYDFGQLQDGTFNTWPTRNLVKNNEKNTLYLNVDADLLEASKMLSNSINLKPVNGNSPKFYIGTIATGDTFVSDAIKAKELYTNFNALATEMEGAAVAQLCSMQQIPYVIIRSCSDNANTNAHTDYFKFVKIAAVNSAKMVLGILENYELK